MTRRGTLRWPRSALPSWRAVPSAASLIPLRQAPNPRGRLAIRLLSVKSGSCLRPTRDGRAARVRRQVLGRARRARAVRAARAPRAVRQRAVRRRAVRQRAVRRRAEVLPAVARSRPRARAGLALLKVAVLKVAVLKVAVLKAAVLKVAVLEAAVLRAAALRAAVLRVAALRVAALRVAALRVAARAVRARPERRRVLQAGSRRAAQAPEAAGKTAVVAAGTALLPASERARRQLRQLDPEASRSTSARVNRRARPMVAESAAEPAVVRAVAETDAVPVEAHRRSPRPMPAKPLRSRGVCSAM